MLDERDEREDVTSEGAGDSPEAQDAPEVDAEQPEAAQSDASADAAEAEDTVARLIRENEELKAREAERIRADESRRAQPPTDPARASELDPNAALVAEMNRLLQEDMLLEAQIASLDGADQDPVVRMLVNMKKQQRIVNQANLKAARDAADEAQVAKDEAYIGSIGDAADRAAFKAWLTPERKRNFRNIQAAHEAFDGHQYRQQKAALGKKQKDAADIIRARDRGVVATGTREIPASEAKARNPKKLTGAAFDAKYDKLMSEGRIDEAVAMSKRAAELIED